MVKLARGAEGISSVPLGGWGVCDFRVILSHLALFTRGRALAELRFFGGGVALSFQAVSFGIVHYGVHFVNGTPLTALSV